MEFEYEEAKPEKVIIELEDTEIDELRVDLEKLRKQGPLGYSTEQIYQYLAIKKK